MGSFLITFEPVILVIHFLMAVFLIGTILLQAGKGADIGAAFGAGGSQTLFGARGAATFLSKLTTGVAVVFLLTSLSLATSAKFSASGGAGTSIIEEQLKKDQTDETQTDDTFVPTDETEGIEGDTQ